MELIAFLNLINYIINNLALIIMVQLKNVYP